MSQTLDCLLRDCTVRLSVLNRAGWGTGFFITPNLIATCAHVIREAELSSIKAFSLTQDVYMKFKKKYDFHQFNLVLLQIQGSITDCSCVFVGDEFHPGDPLYTYGYPDDFKSGASVTGICEGLALDNDIPLIKFKAAQIRPGLSGAPLLNQRTGKVCGVVKFTRDRSTDLGGGAISIPVYFNEFNELISAQRKFHQNEMSWTKLLPTQAKPLNSVVIRHQYLRSILSEECFNRWATEKYINETVRPLPMNVAPRNFRDPNKLRGSSHDLIEAIEQCFERHEYVLILGDPGAGKSTCLERLMYLYACRGLHDNDSPLPILIPLNRYVGNVNYVIQAAFNKIHNFKSNEEKNESFFDEASALFLFDGLNELGENREESVRFICNFMRANPWHRYVFTCRTQDYNNEIDVVESWEIQPLNERDIENYLVNHLHSKGEVLFDEIRKDQRLLTLVQNPLMLRMVRDAGETGSLPKNRGDLYKTFVKKNLWREQKKGNKFYKIPGNVKEKALAKLAYKMQENLMFYCKDRDIKDCFKEYLDDWDEPYNWRKLLIEIEINGLLYSVEDGWVFMHQSVQEFFAALELENNLDILLGKVIGKSAWNEVILLLSGFTKQSSYLVNSLLDIDLFMSVKSVIQGATPNKKMLTFIISKLGEASQSENWTMRRTCADLRGELRSALAHPYLITLLRDTNKEVRWGAIHAIRLIGVGGDNIILNLLPSLQDSHWVAQGEAAMTIGEIGTFELIPQLVILLESSNAYVRISATYALVKLGINLSIIEVQRLINHASNEKSKVLMEFAIQVVASSERISFIRCNLKNKSPLVREASLMLLVRDGERIANSDIIELLSDRFSSVRSAAVAALGKLQAKQFIEEIAQLALNDVDAEVRSSAVGALESLHSNNTISYLLSTSEDTSPNVRAVVARSLGRLRSTQARSILKKLAQFDSNKNVRIHAIRAIGFIAIDEDINYLQKILVKEKETEVIQSINEAIDNIVRGERKLRF